MVPASPLTALPAGVHPFPVAPAYFGTRIDSVGSKLDILSRPRSAPNNYRPVFTYSFPMHTYLPFGATTRSYIPTALWLSILCTQHREILPLFIGKGTSIP